MSVTIEDMAKVLAMFCNENMQVPCLYRKMINNDCPLRKNCRCVEAQDWLDALEQPAKPELKEPVRKCPKCDSMPKKESDRPIPSVKPYLPSFGPGFKTVQYDESDEGKRIPKCPNCGSKDLFRFKSEIFEDLKDKVMFQCRGCKEILISLDKGEKQINEDIAKSEQNLFICNCAQCGGEMFLSIKNPPETPEQEFHLKCEKCGYSTQLFRGDRVPPFERQILYPNKIVFIKLLDDKKREICAGAYFSYDKQGMDGWDEAQKIANSSLYKNIRAKSKYLKLFDSYSDKEIEAAINMLITFAGYSLEHGFMGWDVKDGE